MKAKNKVLLSSIASIALCSSIAVGGTFALFTSNSEVSIAVTSGKVNVVASIDETTLKTYSMDVEQPAGEFQNGGTATLDGESKLNLDLMSPGDKAEFEVDIKNNSNIAIQYRVTFSVEGALAEALECSVTGGSDSWTYVEAEADIDPLTVTVALPEDVSGEEYMEKGATVTVKVEAVQGNADTGIKVPEDAVAVSNFEEFSNALTTGGNLEITAPFTVEGSLEVSADTVLYNTDPANVLTFAQNARLQTAENADLALYGIKINGGGSFELTEDSFMLDGTKTINNDAILMAFAGSTLTLGRDTVIENVVSSAPAVAWAKGNVDNRATIILEGATIRNCAGGSGTVINVDRYGDVYIEEGTLIANNVSSSGNHGIIRIYNDNWDAVNASTLNMNGGEIRDNYFSGNGMIGLYYSKMNMNGGKIYNNSWHKATATGNGFYCVVYVHVNSQFVMNGGEISGNTITEGVINAINSEVEGAITFNGGTVTNNSNTRNENKDALAAVCYPGAVAFSDGSGKVLVISDEANVTGTIYSHANLNDQVDKQYIEISEFLAE